MPPGRKVEQATNQCAKQNRVQGVQYTVYRAGEKEKKLHEPVNDHPAIRHIPVFRHRGNDLPHMPDPVPVGKAETVGKIVRHHRCQSGQPQNCKKNKNAEKQKKRRILSPGDDGIPTGIFGFYFKRLKRYVIQRKMLPS